MLSDKDDLQAAKDNALRMMRDSGFAISDKLEVVVDSDLPFMGYSTTRRNGSVIVVSGMALKSGLVEGLLIHEMCHVYRTKTKHPSHNSDILNRVGYHLIHEYQLTKDYQIRTVQQAVNHIQDLYADDIAFQVFNKSGVFTPKQAFNFFLDWIQDEPIESKSDKAKWLNVSTMLNNCFAISNLQRHSIKDVDNQAESKVQTFLSRINTEMRAAFDFFKNFMINLKEDVAQEKFENDLTEYLTKTVQTASTMP